MAVPQKRNQASNPCWLWVSLFFFVLVSGALRIYLGPYWAMPCLAFAACAVFTLLLEMKASRVKKGLSIIAFGAFVPVWSKVLFHDAGLGEVAKGSVEVLTQMFSLASAGAGGSIVAVHGDKSATDNEVNSTPFQITSDTQRILELEQASRSQGRWIKMLCLLVGLLAVGIFLNLLIH